MQEINCLGEMCPIPVLRMSEALKKMPRGDSIKLITDHSCVVESILAYCKKSRATAEPDEVINGVWEIIITKN